MPPHPPGSDLIIFHTTDQSAWTATDAHAKVPGQPIKDAVQDVAFNEMAFDPTSGTWAGVVSRKAKTCDLDDDVEIQGGRGFNVMWWVWPSCLQLASLRGAAV